MANNKKITKKLVDSLRPGHDKDAFVWDVQLPGFGVRVTPRGVKSYVIQYKTTTGTSRRHTLGKHGHLTPDLAREMAMQKFARVAQGYDPVEEKRANQKEMTVSQLCDFYIAEGCRHKKMSSHKIDKSRIEWHIKPILGSMKISAVKRKDVEKLLYAVEEGKTINDAKTCRRGRAIVSGGKGVANRCVAVLSAVFTFAIRQDLITDNPCRGVKKFKEEGRERFLSGTELKQLEQALVRAEDNGEHPSPINAIRLLMLTGCRKGEILSLKWEYIDWDKSYLRLPDSKTGRKNIPVAPSALEVLRNITPFNDNPYVIYGNNQGQYYIGIQKVWDKIRKDAGLADVRLHDLRHSFASMALARGYTLYEIGALLGHKSVGTTARYAHLADDPLKQAADETAGSIQAAMNNSGDDNVYPLKRKAS